MRVDTTRHDETATPTLGLVRQQLGTTGRWQVTTGSSTYLLDLDVGTAIRTAGTSVPLQRGAAPSARTSLRRDGEPVALHSVVLAEVGSPLVLVLEPAPGVLTLRRSTPVRLIARAGPVPRGRRPSSPGRPGGADHPPAGGRAR